METPKPRRERRVQTQTFYPSPASFSEPDPYEYSSDDDESDYDDDGFKKTLVRPNFVFGMCAWRRKKNLLIHSRLPHDLRPDNKPLVARWKLFFRQPPCQIFFSPSRSIKLFLLFSLFNFPYACECFCFCEECLLIVYSLASKWFRLIFPQEIYSSARSV